jgi:2,3-bisphosphoglycerate-independent phosphoglycerate mutase
MELNAHKVIPQKKPVLVCILDGWGENENLDEHNAVHVAKTPTMDALKAKGSDYYRTVQAHGTAVGLPTDADMGNSEVGHNALGAGKVIAQGASLVDIALESKSMFSDAGWSYIKPAFENNTLHLIGLMSDGGVHSRMDQIFGMMRGAIADGCKKLRLHMLTDGRDVADGTCHDYMKKLVEELDSYAAQGCDAKVASGGGRMAVTMDRYEADWAMVERGWKAHVLGEAEHKFKCPKEALTELKKGGATDQYVEAFVIR